MKFSQSSERLAQVAPLELLLLVAGGLAIHLLYLALNMSAVKLLPVGLCRGQSGRAIGQSKNAAGGHDRSGFSTRTDETKGLIAIPCITFHFGQIFLDAFLATRWGNRVDG